MALLSEKATLEKRGAALKAEGATLRVDVTALKTKAAEAAAAGATPTAAQAAAGKAAAARGARGRRSWLPLILTLRGRWRPADARRDIDDHERAVIAELKGRHGSPAATAV